MLQALNRFRLHLKTTNPILYFSVPYFGPQIIVFFLGILFDPRIAGGFNTWNRIFLFACGYTVFLLTTILYLDLFKKSRLTKLISLGLLVPFMVEVAIFVIQAFRGEQPHYRYDYTINGRIYELIGTVILPFLFFFAYLVSGLFLPHRVKSEYQARPLLLWGFRFGAIFCFVGAMFGYALDYNMSSVVGGEMGPPAVPFLTWSTAHGDMRFPHFVGIHGYQFFPLVAFLLEKYVRKNRWALFGFAILFWAAFFANSIRITYLGLPFYRLF